jgi:hypothetical protein
MKQLPEERNKPENYMPSMISIALMGGYVLSSGRDRRFDAPGWVSVGSFTHSGGGLGSDGSRYRAKSIKMSDSSKTKGKER